MKLLEQPVLVLVKCRQFQVSTIDVQVVITLPPHCFSAKLGQACGILQSPPALGKDELVVRGGGYLLTVSQGHSKDGLYAVAKYVDYFGVLYGSCILVHLPQMHFAYCVSPGIRIRLSISPLIMGRLKPCP
jgi:hypothetical protein